MRPIIRSATHNKVRRDPILGRDPWFENPGPKETIENLQNSHITCKEKTDVILSLLERIPCCFFKQVIVIFMKTLQ